MLLELGAEADGGEGDPFQGRRRQAAGERRRVDSGAADELERPRRAAPLRVAGGLDEAGARVDQRGLEARQVGRRRHPRPAQLGPEHRPAPAVQPPDPRPSRQPPRSASSSTSSARVRPWRTGSSKGADERLEALAPEVALDHLAAERVRPVQQPDLAAGAARRPRRPDGAGGVGVVARADVLQIDQQQVEPREQLGLRPQRPLAVAIEGVDRDAGPRIPASRRRDHVLLDAVVAVLGGQQQRRRHRQS